MLNVFRIASGLVVCLSVFSGLSCKVNQGTRPTQKVLGRPAVLAANPLEGKVRDNIKKRSLEQLEWIKVPNLLVMTPPGPRFLWIPVPRGSKLEALGSQGKSPDRWYKVILTPAGIRIKVSIYKPEKGQWEAMAGSSISTAERIIALPWVGLLVREKGSLVYMLGHPEKILSVSAAYPSTVPQSEVEAICEGIIENVRVDGK